MTKEYTKASTVAFMLCGFTAVGLQLTNKLELAALGLLIILTACILWERSALKRVGKLRFWIVGIMISGLSGLLLGQERIVWHGVTVSPDGMRIGVMIVLRMAIFVLLLMGISRRLRPEFVVRVFGRLGFPQFGGALAMATELLPAMADAWRARMKRGHSVPLSEWPTQLVSDAAALADRIAMLSPGWLEDGQSENIFVVTGKKDAGKTTFLSEMSAKLSSENIPVHGFVQEKHFNDGSFDGFDLQLVASGLSAAILRHSPSGSGWIVHDEAFEAAALEFERAPSGGLFVVDEIGWTENEGGGHWPALVRGLANRKGLWLLSVRHDAVDDIMEKLGCDKAGILNLPVSVDERSEFISKIADRLKAQNEKS